MIFDIGSGSSRIKYPDYSRPGDPERFPL